MASASGMSPQSGHRDIVRIIDLPPVPGETRQQDHRIIPQAEILPEPGPYRYPAQCNKNSVVNLAITLLVLHHHSRRKVEFLSMVTIQINWEARPKMDGILSVQIS